MSTQRVPSLRDASADVPEHAFSHRRVRPRDRSHVCRASRLCAVEITAGRGQSLCLAFGSGFGERPPEMVISR
jgi:hypothetical protein